MLFCKVNYVLSSKYKMSSDTFKSPNAYVVAGKLHNGCVLLLIAVLSAYVLAFRVAGTNRNPQRIVT